jgi:enhancing lycopene biosynthesis protein 2
MTKKAAIVLAGCGVKDGSEIHEAVLALLGVVKAEAEPVFFAPSKPQTRVMNHLTLTEQKEERSMLVEAARIARGEIDDIKNLSAVDHDVLIFPGGLGAAVNLCNFAEKGSDCSVDPEVERVINEFHQAGKPIGFICIAPAIAARVLGKEGVEVTIGNDAATADKIGAMGAKHILKSSAADIHIDEKNKVVSTPAYMLAKNIAEAEAGISKLVHAALEMS